ncbi:DnaT-like ssDNA-binding domain-containing protein [Spongiibacter marinus]|uniref:DnaT-like ssDNA-binding domain-containing protein n=1 Tax=Spongiibacter marinus TaxID=354246 RepID=UPI0004001830|nr:DnaT-like ssDNA-binding domain-containing protein [Spongiibacter marinus]
MSAPLLERPLLVSPTLAATIGLECALLYQLLADWQPLLEVRPRQGQDWLLIDRQRLEEQLPFWQSADIDRLLQQLHDQGLIIIGGALISNARNIRFAMPAQQTGAPQNAPARPASTRPEPTVRSSAPAQAVPGRQLISADWRPDPAAVEYLTRFNRVSNQFIEACIPEFIAHYRESGEARSSWSSTFSQYVSRRWKKQQYAEIEQARHQVIDNHWRPSRDALEILLRDGISEHFIEDAIPEFILYWRERGTQDSNWNSRFLQHIRLQWARYTNAVSHEKAHVPISSNWQPSPEVFEILRMARIDADFAREQIPEFILFWRDSGQTQRSWNTKFLQHVKYRWAHSHQLDKYDARQQKASGSSQAATGFIDKHTDRSWADGL